VTDTSGSVVTDAVAGDSALAGAVDACTTGNAPFETAFWELPEQPRMLKRTPVDVNKTTFFILVSL